MIIYNPLSDYIEIYQDTYTFNDVYTQINDKTIIDRVGSAYEIYKDIRIMENAKIVDENVSVIIYGEFFRIDKGSELRLGQMDANGRTSAGCYLKMPNPKIAYGFGCNELIDNKTQSGNLYLYGSVVDIFCFWGFFSGEEQHVEVIDCNINAFGRVEGPETILRNINFTESHPRYGCLSPKGTIKVLENLSSKKSTDCSVYLNPNFVDDMRVVGGTYTGYERLIYSENNPKDERIYLNFIDTEIIGNYEGKWGTLTGMRMFNTFNPMIIDPEGDIIVGADVVVKNANGLIVAEEVTDEFGEIYVELLNKEFSDVNIEGTFYNPFTVTATYGDITVQRRFNIDKAFKGLPLTLAPEGVAEACDLSSIQELVMECHGATQQYMLGLQDMTASGARILAKYGYKPQAFVGDPSYLSLSKDNFITLEEEDAEVLYNDITINEATKIINANGHSLSEVYHATHLKQIKDVSRDYIYRANSDGSFSLLNDWDIENYVDDRTYIDYRIINGIRVYGVRNVPFDVSLSYEHVNSENHNGSRLHAVVKDVSETVVWEFDDILVENAYHLEVPTDGQYTMEISMYKDNGERVYYDFLRLPRTGHRIMTRSININPELQEPVVYVNNHSSAINEDHKYQILGTLQPELASVIKRYTDLTSDPWDARGSYDALMMRCARGEISRIYVWEKEEFGHTRTKFTEDLLNNLGVELIETRHMLAWEDRTENGAI